LRRSFQFDNGTHFVLRKKGRTPTGTFLSNRMRNSMALRERQDCLDLHLRDFELPGNFSELKP
jgi:hypothetical protein